MTALPAGFLDTFRESMPPSYRQQQTADEIRAHAQIVWRRGDEPAHAEIWSKRLNALVVCLVTDERPGLSSLVRATVAAHGVDILAAQTYIRNNERGLPEAVHFLWLSAARDGGGPPVGDGDVSQISSSLSELLRGETDLGTVIERASTAPPSRPPTMVDVGFPEDMDHDGAVLLTVDAIDRENLMTTVTAVLGAKQASVLHSDVSTSGRQARARLQVVEADGSPLTRARAREVADAVLDALRQAE